MEEGASAGWYPLIQQKQAKTLNSLERFQALLLDTKTECSYCIKVEDQKFDRQLKSLQHLDILILKE